MIHYQGGAHITLEAPGGQITGKTKADLKKAIKENPSNVHLYSTNVVGGDRYHGRASNMPERSDFLVVGPDPYTKRDWYATVKWNAKGELRVS